MDSKGDIFIPYPLKRDPEPSKFYVFWAVKPLLFSSRWGLLYLERFPTILANQKKGFAPSGTCILSLPLPVQHVFHQKEVLTCLDSSPSGMETQDKDQEQPYHPDSLQPPHAPNQLGIRHGSTFLSPPRDYAGDRRAVSRACSNERNRTDSSKLSHWRSYHPRIPDRRNE